MGQMNTLEFHTLVNLSRIDPSNRICQASHDVLVDGRAPSDARVQPDGTCTRQSLSNAIARYKRSYALVRSCYPIDAPKVATMITAQQFEALVTLLRGKPAAEGVQYARLRLVRGLPPNEATQILDTQAPIKSLNRTFHRYAEADKKIREAFCTG